MKLSLRWLVLLVLVALIGMAGWLSLTPGPERADKPPSVNPPQSSPKQPLPQASNAPIPAPPAQTPGGRFQTDINPRFQAYSTPRLLDALVTADSAGDRDAVLIALATLERRAQLGDDTVPRLLLDSLGRFSAEKRLALVKSLGRIASPAALDALFELTQPATAPALRREALAEISRVGTHTYDNGEYPVELSPPLEQRLPQAMHDPEMLAAVAGGLASVGAASGVEALLDTMAGHPDGPESQIIARQLQAVRNPAAVPALAARLSDDGSAPAPVMEAAGDSLAAMGDPDATEALLNWAAQVEDERARMQALRWLGEVTDEASFERVIEAGSRYTFRDPGLLTAIQARLRAQDAETRPYVEGPGR